MDVKLPNFQLNELKSKTKNATEVTTLKRSSNIIGDSNDETNFPQKLLINRKLLKLRKGFATNSSTNIKLSKTQLSKIVKSIGFLVDFLGYY